MAFTYESDLSAGLSSLSSFARGWATMELQLDQQEAAEKRWKEEFGFRKKAQKTAEDQWWKSYRMQAERMAQDAAIAKRTHDFETFKWDAGTELRKLNLETARLNQATAQKNFDYVNLVRDETAQATEHMFSLIPDLMSTPSDKVGNTLIETMTDTMRAFPNADMSKFDVLFKTISTSPLFKSSQAKMSSTTLETVDEKGNKVTHLLDVHGNELSKFSHNVKSDEVKALIRTWIDRVDERRKEMFKAFAQGSSAKFKGEFNISMADLNNLDVNFHDIVGFADQILDWVERDPETNKMRRSFEKALTLEITDEAERLRVVESVFGTTPSLEEEEMQATVQRYSGIYKSWVAANKKKYPTEADSVADFWMLYRDILDKYSSGDREVLTRSLKVAAQSYFVNEPHLNEEFLRGLDEVARQWLFEQEFVGPPEAPAGWMPPAEQEWHERPAVEQLGIGFD